MCFEFLMHNVVAEKQPGHGYIKYLNKVKWALS